MNTFFKDKAAFITLLILATFIVFYFYGKVIIEPNSYIFADKGDGIKNYYTYLYHINKDADYSEFSGMNYPYGESIFYTDCHPGLANSLKFLNQISPIFGEYAIGILNFILILSIFLTFIIIFYLLREFGNDKWFSVLFSVGITLLSPQIFRLSGHLALSYSIAIPLGWLLMLKMLKQPNKSKWYILLLLNNLLWLFIHAYLGVILISFLFVWFVFQLFQKTNSRNNIGFIFKSSLSIIFPILFFYIWVSLTDSHVGRTDNPSGFFLYNAEPDDIFLPNHPPLRPIWDYLTNNIIKQKWEAFSYVGLFSTLSFLTIIITGLFFIVAKKNRTKYSSFFEDKLLNTSLWASIIVLLFAFGIPFKQINGLIDWLPIFKQFRATGRFTWIFFFVLSIFSAVYANKFVLSLKGTKQKVLTVLLILFGFFNIFEGFPYHADVSNSITNTPNYFKKNSLYQLPQNIDLSHFQAIIPLPFYHYGSESFERIRHDETVKASILVSYYSGIPMFAANLTRIAIWESKNIIEMMGPSYYPKTIVKDLSSNLPFLLITTKDEVSEYEAQLLQKAKLIFQSDQISLYNLDKDALFEDRSNQIISRFEVSKSKLIRINDLLFTSDSSFVYKNDFDKNPSEFKLHGNGAYSAKKEGKNIIAGIPPHTLRTNTKYRFRIWMYNGGKDAINDWFRFMVEEFNQAQDQFITTTFFPDKSEVIFGNWSLIEGDFVVRDSEHAFSFVTIGKEGSKSNFFADELLITEHGVDIYQISKDTLFYNNHIIPYKK